MAVIQERVLMKQSHGAKYVLMPHQLRYLGAPVVLLICILLLKPTLLGAGVC